MERNQPIEVVAAMIIQEDRFLLCQRPEHKSCPLQWEFVGGKVEPTEQKIQALKRECEEELALTIRVGRELAQTVHAYPNFKIHLTLFAAAIEAGTPQLLEHRTCKWVCLSEAETYDLCPADQTLLQQIKCIVNKKRLADLI